MAVGALTKCAFVGQSPISEQLMSVRRRRWSVFTPVPGRLAGTTGLGLASNVATRLLLRGLLPYMAIEGRIFIKDRREHATDTQPLTRDLLHDS